MTRFDVRESLAMTGRGPWVVGEGRAEVGDVLVVAHTGARVQVRAVQDDGARMLLDAPVPAGTVLVGVDDPLPDVAAPTGVLPGPVRYEVQFAGTVAGRGPVLAGLLRRGVVDAGDVLAVVGSGAAVRVRGVDLHRRETVEGTVLGLQIHPDDAGHVAEGAVLVSPEGVR
ncbi:hypothetical protein SAMN05660199_04150 [Klenkia soli]|uniref:Elongation factor Tu n=1 Tax=Klenkia soli TaxID=1052260 RepID=A0A1H0TFY7_9ACTN|nr:hypothetical protein [Klenkia soli]SDP52909.1 hypothetical protein SAMN05660199_04150 [Klenkia soli]